MQNSIQKAAVKFGVSRKSTRQWIQQLSNSAQMPVKSKAKTQHKSQQSKKRSWLNWMDFSKSIIRYCYYLVEAIAKAAFQSSLNLQI